LPIRSVSSVHGLRLVEGFNRLGFLVVLAHQIRFVGSQSPLSRNVSRVSTVFLLVSLFISFQSLFPEIFQVSTFSSRLSSNNRMPSQVLHYSRIFQIFQSHVCGSPTVAEVRDLCLWLRTDFFISEWFSVHLVGLCKGYTLITR